MRTTLALLFLALPAAAADDPAALRARAALALAFAAPPTPPYPDQHAKALRDGTPLVVWVGQPVRPVAGCLTAQCNQFPGVTGPAVVVGVPADGILRRTDLPGHPTDAEVRAATQPANPVLAVGR